MRGDWRFQAKRQGSVRAASNATESRKFMLDEDDVTLVLATLISAAGICLALI